MENVFQLSSDIQFWHWWILGVLLLGLEILVPGTFFLWMGVSAGVVGGLLYALPELSWQGQIAVFAVLSVLAVAGGRLWLSRHPIETADPTLNVRGAQYIGRVLTLAEPVVDGVGKAKVGDSLWRVSTASDEPLPAGARVRVTGVDGATLTVVKE
jgi:membrane protein implicated in regulation of membrane protease activity